MPFGVVAQGLVQGSLYALNSLGLIVLWRVTRVVNLAQSALGLVGGVFTGLLVQSAGWSFWWAAPLGIVTGVLLGMATDRLVLVRLQDAPRVVLLVATIGLAQIFTGLYIALAFAFGGRQSTYDIDLGMSVDLVPVLIDGPKILALVTLPLATFATWWFLHRSRLGIAGLALGQDVERARALGVPAGLIRAVAWGFAGGLGSVSGILSIPILDFGLGEGVGITVLLLALAPAVLAGLRDIHWAVLA
ncbi:MAG: branched-chain amino acid ABC transporter permease, partial [Actinobacteria bacterium]|nr:branched-chain amino acid ABC transporter permease [Actinomycetota bacterium]MCA1721097.1 branched-chain amino acid ABC transporter permease [Actinomycetota bacterium]